MTKINARLPRTIVPNHKHQMVRVGSQFDGGYIIAAPLIDCTDTILTYGLGLNWDFEQKMTQLGHVRKIHCYDHTISKGHLLKRYIKAKIFYKAKPQKYAGFISAYQNYGIFFESESDIKHYKFCVAASDGTGKISVNSTLEKLSPVSDGIFFKCDIEGAEFEIASSIIENAPKFRGIALEFHDVSERLDEVVAICATLQKTHNLDHVHVNNMSKLDANGIPSVIEISMSRHDLKSETSAELLRGFGLESSRDPTALDQPNSPDRPDMAIEYF
jgi:hypothetical protein